MILNDILAEISFDLWMIPEPSKELPNLAIGNIEPDNSNQGYIFRIGTQQLNVTLKDKSGSKDLNFHLRRGCAHLAEVMQIAKDDSMLVKIIFFNGEIVETGDIEIGIDERIEKTARRNGIHFSRNDELGTILAEKCKISVGDEDFFLFMGGPAANADFEDFNLEDEEIIDHREAIQDKYREFSVYGESIRIPVERRKVENTKDIFFATKMIMKDRQKRKGSLRLARGKIVFADYTKTGRIRALAAGAMSKLTKEAGSYLKQWDEYGAVEGDMLLAKAKAIGRIDFHEKEKTNKGVKFFVDNVPNQLSEGDEIEITSEEPLYFTDPEITWENYSKALETEFTASKEMNQPISGKSKDSVFAKIIKLSKTSIELDLSTIPDDQMFLILSINGDKIQIERRMRARSAILEGRCANPLLGLVIEEGGVLPSILRTTKIKPITPFVKRKIFKHPPTDKQIEAIDIALNTPDMALIQGPPGTGKTTVVTAIIERLNEDYDKTKSIRGQILVSGFQHDAVENIVARLSINSLPAVKFGRRFGDSEFTESAVTEKIYHWCNKVAERIRSKNPQITQTEDQIKLFELFTIYSLSPSKSNTINLLKRILGLPRDLISMTITDEANEILKSIQKNPDFFDYSILRSIRALRIRESSFKDDGPARALELLDKLEATLSSSEVKILEKAARWKEKMTLNFLSELKLIKESLLKKYIPQPKFRTEKPRQDVLNLVAKISKLLDSNLKSADKRDAILAEFLHELEDNPDGIRESIEDYNFVFAATTQQAMGKDIIRSKNKFSRFDEKNEMIKYDTVIIDEAARTSPRDLLIPMSQAEKRIILVGDHRQLPHLIDEEVARTLESNDDSDLASDLGFVKKSMFEYLFGRLKKLQEKDGIKRTVTLDAQYRTHPLLGNFVSDNFYAKFNESYRSPLPSSLFDQGLKYSNPSKNLVGNQNIEHNLPAAVWIDVDNSLGNEGKRGTSRIRAVEAEAISDYLNKWLNTEEGKTLSFGVISFYKAQVNAIYESLKKNGITSRAQDGSWQISKDYRYLDDGKERLRIGSVDAFQGMEFDVVFLSMVRSQDINKLEQKIKKEDNYDILKRRTFGHLMSENRLCVSMSRQKRVLIVVGDTKLVRHKIAIDAIPALKNFYDLCYSKGVIL